MAKYKKKRARQLQHDRFRDTTLGVFDRLGNQFEGKGRTILYAIGAVVLLAILVGTFNWWRGRKNDEARRALGRAIEIATAPVTTTPISGQPGPTFSTENERAQRAVEEFQKVADKYNSSPYHEIAQYFKATNLVTLDRSKGIGELQSLTGNSDAKVSTLAKFALAQAKEADAKYDEAAALYSELAKQNGEIVTVETANLRLAIVDAKLGKKKEAADLLFTIVDNARKAKDKDNKPAPQSEAARAAAQELQKVDPERYAQLPPEPTEGELGV